MLVQAYVHTQQQPVGCGHGVSIMPMHTALRAGS